MPNCTIEQEKRFQTYQQRFVLGTSSHIIEFSSLNDLSIDLELLLRTSKHELFDGIGRDQTENSDFLLLTDTMRTAISYLSRNLDLAGLTDPELEDPHADSNRYRSWSVSD
jgi:hypothetical protein